MNNKDIIPFSLDYKYPGAPKPKIIKHKKEIRKSGKKVLCIAEKPLIAKAVAAGLSARANNKPIIDKKGIVTPIHEVDGIFNNEAVTFICSSVTGHVYGTDFAPGYKWGSVHPSALFTAPLIKVPADNKGLMVKHLQKLAKNIDYLILWLDCDIEGENICYEVIYNVEPLMYKASNPSQQVIYRAFFSAIGKQDIIKAMNNLGKPNLYQSLASEARQELDLRMGVAFTRYQSDFFQGKYGNLNTRLISFGPCQTPTLNFVVKRHDIIETFKPESYWTLSTFITANLNISAKKFIWSRNKIFNIEMISLYRKLLLNSSKVILKCIDIKKINKKVDLCH